MYLVGIGILAAAGTVLTLTGRRPSSAFGPPGTPELEIAERCRRKPAEERQACILAGLEARIRPATVAGAMASLKVLAMGDPDIEQDAHVYAHGIGIKGYLLGKDVAAVFGQCPADFASGCRHGAIQAYLESRQSLDSVALNGLCAPYRDPFSATGRWQLFQCVHGMGHGLIMMLGGDLPRALTSCDMLSDPWDRDACYGGAFMENIMRATAPHHPASELAASHHGHQAFQAIDSTDLLYPCSIVANQYQRACYQIQTAAIFHFTKGDVGAASRACDRAPETMQPTCYVSLGRDLSSKGRRDPGRVLRYCGETGERHRPWCYYGATKALIDWETDPTAGITFCKRVGERPGFATCFLAVGEQLTALGRPMPEREATCRQAGGPRAVSACSWGAQLRGSVPPEDAGLVTTYFPAPPRSGPGPSTTPPTPERSR